MTEDTRDYQDIFLHDRPLLDVRAPVEFGKGAFPGAENRPILDDEQRHRIGIRYKQKGQRAAIELGHELVSGKQREARIRGWLEFARRHPEGFLYCFRGGLRSQTAQAWMRDAGVEYRLVQGGYKAMRRFLIEQFERHVNRMDIRLLSGRTGTGKTRVLVELEQAVDLEGIAHHRGSAFGRRPGGQPSQIDFENRLSIALLKLAARGIGTVLLEDESRLIGRCHIPLLLQDRMKEAPRVLVEEPVESRVQLTLEDYVIGPLQEYRDWFGEEEALARLSAELLDAMDRIRKRLGGARHRELRGQLERALNEQARSGDTEGHRSWIRELLSGYYDPMYDHMLEKRGGTIVFAGSRNEVREWLLQNKRRYSA